MTESHRLASALTMSKAVRLAVVLGEMSIQILDYETLVAGRDRHLDHPSPRWNTALQLGIKGVREFTEKTLKRLPNAPENKDKREFLGSMIVVMNAISDFIKRYSQEAKRLSSLEKDSKRKKELQEISKISQRLSSDKPKSLIEARQLVWFLHIVDTELIRIRDDSLKDLQTQKE